MIDFFKCEVFGLKASDWLDNVYLDFTETASMKTGLINNKRIANFSCLKFIIYDDENICRMFIHGSIHKFFNLWNWIYAPNQKTVRERSEGFNGNSFTYSNLVFSLQVLTDKFNVDLKKTAIQNLEFGVNCIHSFITSSILANLMLHKQKVFNKPLSNTFREAEHFQFYIKCYDKALQYGMLDEVIRFELKYKKMHQLNEIGINNLLDLISIKNLERLKAILLQRWSEVLIYDYTINETALTTIDRIRIKDFKNPNYWLSFKSNRLDRPKKSYAKIEAQHSDRIKIQIQQIISNEWDKLMMCVSSDHSDIRSILTHPNNLLLNFPILQTHY